ncbi:M6 family metalloprotease domain-containing protein [Lentibacillus lipolyticus]|nr:M6 family metalloprotease domain-containing protein [Lentibacillus lipolyticus]
MQFIRKSLLGMLVFLFVFSSAATVYEAKPGQASFPKPVDTESWVLPENMTWEDYKPVPGYDWKDVDIKPEKELKGALIVVDFPDREFIITQEEESGLAGNPINGGIPREDVPQYWEDFLMKPQKLNNFTTINQFWRENSFGKWAVDIDAFGTYRMDHNEFEYGMGEFGQQENMPDGYDETYNVMKEAREKAEADIKASGEEYDFTFVLHAGYSESAVWQEFGEMMFNSPEEVSDEFGPPAKYGDMPNDANTRYVDWTSWTAASSIWSRADIRNGMSVQAESSGMGTFAHEFGHIMNLLDNYNNPYADPVSRSYSGPWALMSRGSFNGPGGPHTRFHVMPTMGGSTPSHHMLRNKIKQGFLTEDQYINVDRDELAEEGPMFANILAREVPSGSEFGRPDVVTGINIEMDEDKTPVNSLEDDWRADMQRGEDWYDNYTIEVVDRVGFDSFQTDSGVLMAKTKDTESAPNIWVIDSHPEDINQVDFIRPDGTEAMYSKGDYRQLSDALFKAGTDDGIVSEYQDEHNRLHFYVLDKNRDEEGALSYRVAVRHMDESGDDERGVEATEGQVDWGVPGRVATYNFKVNNTGETADLFRININTQSDWETMLEHDVIEVEAGETVNVPVYVKIPKGGKGNKQPSPTEMTFDVTSETDSNASATVTRRVGPGNGK